jgi:hypothetical protein
MVRVFGLKMVPSRLPWLNENIIVVLVLVLLVRLPFGRARALPIDMYTGTRAVQVVVDSY